MSVSVLVCAHGADAWRDLAWSRAYPSAASQGAREVIVEWERDSTLAEIRNQAARQATGHWLCFLDADDELAPGYLDAMTATGLLEVDDTPAGWYSPSGLLAPAVEYILPNGRPSSPPAIPNAGRWPDLNECVIGTLVRRSLFYDVGGFREMPSLEDYDLWLRCVIAGATIHHVPDATYRAYVHSRGRNRDQSVYPRLREEHAAAWA